MKTIHANNKTITRSWQLIDAEGKVLGRLATDIARRLTGKGKIMYTPHVDCGDFVVVINAAKVVLTGNNKLDEKIDFRHSGYPGGDTMTPYREFMKDKPDRAISLAVSGMLPKNKLRALQIKRLKVYKGSTHPHGANLPRTKAAVEQPVAVGA
jgi:large subunit ribosomal protein L13